jgi:hypothetical protein
MEKGPSLHDYLKYVCPYCMNYIRYLAEFSPGDNHEIHCDTCKKEVGLQQLIRSIDLELVGKTIEQKTNDINLLNSWLKKYPAFQLLGSEKK